MLVGKGCGRNGRVVAMAGTSVASAATEHMGCVALGAFLSAREERARERERCEIYEIQFFLEDKGVFSIVFEPRF